MNAKKTIEKEKFVYPNTRFNVKQFEKHIEKTAPKKMCLLYSDIENANIDEFLDALKKKINVPENNVFVYSGAELDIPQFINDYSTQPLFSERRLFVIKEINKCQQKRNKNFCEKFYEVLEENIEDTYLFIVNERLSEKKITEFLKSIIIRVFTFLLREQSVEQWIMDYVQKNNREIEYSAVRKLMVLCNERIGLIKNELTKIFLYDLQGKNITEELINKVIQSYDEKNIFKFIDALLNKDYDKSIIFYRQLLNQKENNITIIIFNITERLNKLIYFIETAKKIKAPDINKVGELILKEHRILLNYYEKTEFLKLKNKYDEQSIKKALKLLIEMESYSKSRPQYYTETAFEIFILKFCRS